MAHHHRLIGVSVHVNDVTHTLGGYNYKAASPKTFPTGNNAVPKLSDRNSPVSVRLPSQPRVEKPLPSELCMATVDGYA